MIIRQEGSDYIFIRQHEHARLAGWLAALWGNDLIPPAPEPCYALILAVTLHDVGWRPLDQDPVWDQDASSPYDFTNEPLDRKLPQYHAGIDFVEALDPYAALLCSRHYTSFFPPAATTSPGETQNFVTAEMVRQSQLRDTLRKTGRQTELSREDFDLGLLKLWDHLSLYVAVNQPGTAKSQEHPWYQEGFPPTYMTMDDYLAQRQGDLIQFSASWASGREIALTPFPLRASLPYALTIRQVTRQAIAQHGFETAYHQAKASIQVISYIPSK
jgi:hypothetical protein